MKALDMNAAKAWFSYAGLRLGRCGGAGLMLLFGCTVVIGAQTLRSHTDTLSQRIDGARAELKSAATPIKPVATAQTTSLPWSVMPMTESTESAWNS